MALFGSFVNEALGDGHTSLLISKTALIAFAVAIWLLTRCFPRLYLYAGPLVIMAFLTAHTVPMDLDFDGCLNLFYLCTDLFYLSVVIVDHSWILTLLLYVGSSTAFWLRWH